MLEDVIAVDKIVGGYVQAGGNEIVGIDFCRRAKVDPVRVCQDKGTGGS